MSMTLLDERRYRELLDVTLPVVIRTEEEYSRLLSAAAALMEKPEDGISEEEGRLLEMLSILIENTKIVRTRCRRPNHTRCWPIYSRRRI